MTFINITDYISDIYIEYEESIIEIDFDCISPSGIRKGTLVIAVSYNTDPDMDGEEGLDGPLITDLMAFGRSFIIAKKWGYCINSIRIEPVRNSTSSNFRHLVA